MLILRELPDDRREVVVDGSEAVFVGFAFESQVLQACEVHADGVICHRHWLCGDVFKPFGFRCWDAKFWERHVDGQDPAMLNAENRLSGAEEVKAVTHVLGEPMAPVISASGRSH